jgi:hypothetical protein
MDVLCLADIHGERDALLQAKKKAEELGVRTILVLGDFPSHSSFRDVQKGLGEVRFVLDTLSDFDVFCVPGNCDSLETLDVFEEYGVNLHEKTVAIKGVTFVGFGGSSPTPFGTPFEFGEDVISEKLGGMLSKLAGERVVVVAHNPPYGTNCDVRSSGEHVGSRAMRSLVERFQPEVFLCSHIHESGGSSDVVGGTRVLNVGPLAKRRYALLSVGGVLDVRLGVFD